MIEAPFSQSYLITSLCSVPSFLPETLPFVTKPLLIAQISFKSRIKGLVFRFFRSSGIFFAFSNYEKFAKPLTTGLNWFFSSVSWGKRLIGDILSGLYLMFWEVDIFHCIIKNTVMVFKSVYRHLQLEAALLRKESLPLCHFYHSRVSDKTEPL